MAAKIRVGPAGWSYDDWRGIVYPEGAGAKFDQLAYIAGFFDTIEINSSFYRPPTSVMGRSWVRRTAHNADFKFTAKLYKMFTHERGKATERDEHAFRAGIEPLSSAGKLGGLLMQFPWSFKNNDADSDYLFGLMDRFKDYPLIVEVRHGSWNTPEIYEALEERQVGFCNIDQPLFGRSIKPSAQTTSRIGYVRLHGRNYENWFAENKSPADRYDYLYSPEELAPWIDNIKNVARHTRETYVITNNHFRGKGIVNALEIKSALEGAKVQGPASLAAEYPRIKDAVILS
ncbi:MAG: DUF72 domain-containing protein [Blastocatellia bacterium]